jgi:hypothetical protein
MADDKDWCCVIAVFLAALMTFIAALQVSYNAFGPLATLRVDVDNFVLDTYHESVMRPNEGLKIGNATFEEVRRLRIYIQDSKDTWQRHIKEAMPPGSEVLRVLMTDLSMNYGVLLQFFKHSISISAHTKYVVTDKLDSGHCYVIQEITVITPFCEDDELAVTPI